jgi:hypothetical protein
MRLISETELKKYGKTYNVSRQAIALVNQQKATWPLATANYNTLKTVRESSFSMGHFTVKYQFNQERIRSSAADISKEAILARPCFLCAQNLPSGQYGIPFGSRFIILVNPFPIFTCHLTIPSVDHSPQKIDGNLGSLLDLSYALSDFVVFYNGPKCGASAPDHFHFQAGIRETLPVEAEFDLLRDNHSVQLFTDGKSTVFAVENYLRRFIGFQNQDKEEMVRQITHIIGCLPKTGDEEPMMNILAWYQFPYWKAVIFPRALQRPWQYYSNDFNQLIISPAAVEMGGLFILPREEDYYKLTEKDLISIYDQVTMQKDDFAELRNAVYRQPGYEQAFCPSL